MQQEHKLIPASELTTAHIIVAGGFLYTVKVLEPLVNGNLVVQVDNGLSEELAPTDRVRVVDREGRTMNPRIRVE